MRADKKQINGIFITNKLLEIPFYQRSYVWGESEWERLLEDIRDMCERREEYFLGSIILKDTVFGEDESNPEKFAAKYVVVDGQQRLTTLLIMMRVIAILNDELENFDYYFFKNMKKENIHAVCLRHNHKDRPDFERIMQLETLEDLKGKVGVVGAYNYFRENITESDAKTMHLESMVQYMVFVMIEVLDNEDEQQIFDTINSLGVRLTTAELLKNYFFSKAEIQQYRDNWESVFETDSDTREYWDQEVTTGRLKRSLIDLFFDSLLQILVEDGEIDVKEADKKAYERVDRLFQSYRSFIELKKYRSKQFVLDAIKPYASRFRLLFKPDVVESVVGKTASIDRMNVVIFGLQNSTLIPYVLYLRSRLAHDDDTFNEMLGILEAYIMRRIVCRKSTKNYNRFFRSLIREGIDSPDKLVAKIAAKDDGTTAYADDNELRASFHEERSLTALQARGILYLLETAMWPEGSSVTMLGFKSYSLEHLMPKKWRNHWGGVGSKEAEEQRDKTLLTLGNLAVITQRLNGSISDSAWTAKKAGTKRSKGLALCAGGLPSMEEALKSDVWDEELISERADKLYGYALKAWEVNLPEVSLEVEPEDGGKVLYYCTGGGSKATGYLSSGGFTVLADSVISEQVAPSLQIGTHSGSFEEREALIANGTILNGIFQKDHEFTSPTTAADVVAGYALSGNVGWVTKDGTKLKMQR